MNMTQYIKTTVKFSVFLAVLSCIAVGQVVAASHVAEKSDFSKAADLVREKKYVEAFDIFESLAQAHDSDAQFNAAVFLRKGIGRPSNYPDALKWAWLAELGGNVRAADLRAELVGLMPEEQLGPVRNRVKSVLQGRMDAGETVVILQMADYHLGVEAEPDYKNAYALRSLAAALSIENAGVLRDEVEAELEPEELIEAQTVATSLFSSTTWVIKVED